MAGWQRSLVMSEEVRERVMPLLLGSLILAWIVISIEPFPVGVFEDDGIYTVLAKSVATGQGYRYLHMPDAPNSTHYPPLYPLFLASLWKLAPSFPGNVTLFKFVNAGFCALTAVFAFRFARRQVRMSQWSAFLCVGAFTVCTPLVLLGVMVLSEPMFLAALFPVLVICDRAAHSGDWCDGLKAGVVGGVLAMIRTLGAVTIPATALVLAWRRKWLAAFLVCLAGAAVMAPWQIWVAMHNADVPAVFQGKYGSYSGWLLDGMKSGGPMWIGELIVFNTRLLISQGWETIAVESTTAAARWGSTIMVAALFAGGWWRLSQRVPVAAWFVAIYIALVLCWPFAPARFMFAIWPLLGMIFGLAFETVFSWQPRTSRTLVMRRASLATVLLLAVGYARYEYLGTKRGWWTRVQAVKADRARNLAEWVVRNTPEDAVLATDDDVLIHLYTGRRSIPNGTFTPHEHMKAQTTEFATEVLRTIVRTYDVDYVLAASDYGTYAARGLVQADPPELQIVGVLKHGAIFKPVVPNE